MSESNESVSDEFILAKTELAEKLSYGFVNTVEPFDTAFPFEWKAYVEFVELNFAANDFDTLPEKQQLALFLALAGRKVFEIARKLLAPADYRTFTLAEIKSRLTNYFVPPQTKLMASHHFWSRHQIENETYGEYASVLRALAANCGFGEHLSRALRDRFICGIRNFKIRKRFFGLKSTLTFEEAVAIAVARENDPAILNVQNFAKKEKKNAAKPASKAAAANVSKLPSVLKCWSCNGDHMLALCPYRDSRHQQNKQFPDRPYIPSLI